MNSKRSGAVQVYADKISLNKFVNIQDHSLLFQVSDWRFPYKKSNHPVCVHHGRNTSFVTLRHCEEGVQLGTSHYEYVEADDCKCQICSSSDTSCEGLRYRPHRSESESSGRSLGFIGLKYKK